MHSTVTCRAMSAAWLMSLIHHPMCGQAPSWAGRGVRVKNCRFPKGYKNLLPLCSWSLPTASSPTTTITDLSPRNHEVRWRSWLENRKCGIGTRIRNSRTPLHQRLWADTYSTTFTIRSFKTLPFWNPPQCRFRICEHIQWVRYLCYSNFLFRTGTETYPMTILSCCKLVLLSTFVE